MLSKIHCASDMVQKFLEKYILAIGICRAGGDLLYYFQVDPSLQMDLIAQFIAALSMFGEEKLGNTGDQRQRKDRGTCYVGKKQIPPDFRRNSRRFS